MKIAFVYNLKPEGIKPTNPEAEFFAEFDTPETIKAIRVAIEANGYRVLPLEANEDLYEELRSNREKIDLVFNFAEAISKSADREAHVPMLCEILKIPYSGPTPLSAALILDKTRTKEIWEFYGVPTPPFQLFENGNEALMKKLSFPLIVKPNSEGSSQGIKNDSVVKNEEELKQKVKELLEKFKQPILVEKFLTGREFTVSMIGNEKSLESLPIVEINFDNFPPGVKKIDGFEAKWLWEHSDKPIESVICPAKVDDELRRKIEDLAKKAFVTIGCRDWGRVDMRMDDENNLYALEINCPVGLIPNPKEYSKLPTAARAAGMNFKQLVGKIIKTALARYGKLEIDAQGK